MSEPVCTCAMRPWRPMRPCPVHARRDEEPPERVWIRHGMDVFTKCVPESDEYVLAERERAENTRLRAIIGTVHECVHPGFPIETRAEMAAVIEMVRGVLNAAGGAT